MPDPTLDPRWIAVAARCRALRVDLDRLDDTLDLLDSSPRRSPGGLALGAGVGRADGLDVLVEEEASL